MNPAANPDLDAIIAPHVLEDADRLRTLFLPAEPFAHCVIDNFFAPGFVQALARDFPSFDRGNSLNEDGSPAGKSVVERLHSLGETYALLDRCVQSPAFLELVGSITGIGGLLYDPSYFGGGTHENRNGQSLDSHIDFNYHPETGWHRRLNMIVYLNQEWDADWGGALQLHRDPYDAAADKVVSLAPLYNRCVIFETTEHSWHGFPAITLPADKAGLSRRSIALYFYTRERPPEQTASAHSTVYVDRPLPARFEPGHVLSAGDCDELNELMQRRGDHNRRLYDEIRRLQSVLDETALSRVFSTLRRLLARIARH